MAVAAAIWGLWRPKLFAATSDAQRWRLTHDAQAWPAEEIELACAWYADGEDVVVIDLVCSH